MNVGQKINQMKIDLAKIVNLCNEKGDYRLANIVQSCLQTVGGLSQHLGEGEGAKVAETEFGASK